VVDAAGLGGVLAVPEKDHQRSPEPPPDPLERGGARGAGQVDHHRVDRQVAHGRQLLGRLELCDAVVVSEQGFDRDGQRGVARQQDHAPGHYDQYLRERGGMAIVRRMPAAPR
jgi:hypothetical protein